LFQTLKQTTDIIPKDADVEGRHQMKEETTTPTSNPIQVNVPLWNSLCMCFKSRIKCC